MDFLNKFFINPAEKLENKTVAMLIKVTTT